MKDTSFVAVISGLVGVALSQFVTYLTSRRKSSGKVATTDADRLWDAVQAWATTTAQRAQQLEKKTDEQSARILELERKDFERERKLDNLLKENDELKRTVATLTKRANFRDAAQGDQNDGTSSD